MKKKLPYSQKTQDLIDRMCKNVEREDFELFEHEAAEALLKTYDVFDLDRPKRIVWCKDLFDESFQGSAWSAWSARSVWSAWSVWSARSARSAGSAWSAGSAGSVWSAGSAGSARSAWSVWSARSAGSAGSAGSARSAWSVWSARSAGSAGSAWSAGSVWSALDYDFDWYIFNLEYKESESDWNENDVKYLEYCELLMQAKEFGLGYRVEWQDTLYLVPTPLVKVDEKNKYSSLTGPAIRWKDGAEFYYINGVNFDKQLWRKVVNNDINFKEVSKIENIEQRMIALRLQGAEKLLRSVKANLVDTYEEYKLYLVEDIFSVDAYFLKYSCPSTGRVYVSGVDPDIGKERDALAAIAWKFGCTKEEYKHILAHA